MPADPRNVIIIPARYASSRYPGKPLVALRGASGVSRSLIERSWLAAKEVSGIDAIWVATDDDRIADAARGFGADVVMTSDDCANGTLRCADAITRLGIEPDIVVNLQGDAPLTPPWFVEALVAAMASEDSDVATPVLRCTPEIHTRLLDDRSRGLVGGTTAVMNAAGQALYFSKEVLPFTGRSFASNEQVPVFHHVGIYAYTAAALAAYSAAAESEFEGYEGLEQLRFLYHGFRVRCVEVDAHGREFWELNNPADVGRIEAILASEGLE